MLAICVLPVLIALATVLILFPTPQTSLTVRCVEPSGSGETIHGPFIVEYWGTTIEGGQKFIFLFQTGQEMPDFLSPGIARYWIGDEVAVQAKYGELASGVPNAGDGIVIISATAEPHDCPTTP